MGHRTLLTIFVAGSLAVSGGPAEAQAGTEAPLEARLWVGWEDEPVLRRGERVRIQFRTSMDAYVAVFRIDTDGRVALLSPGDPLDDGLRAGGRDQELALATSPFWTVADDPGTGYMFLVASPVPLDFSRFGFYPDFGWDLSPVASTVYADPYLAMDDFIAAILPDWRDVGYALDFVNYHVDGPRSYPRFLCYDCHAYQSFDEWNPYDAMCSSYRVVVYDDPYYYPVYRYAGTRVIYPMPIPDRPRYEVTARRSAKAWAPIVRVRSAPPAQVTFKESPASVPGGRAVRRSTAGAGGAGAPSRSTTGRASGTSYPARPPVTRGGTSPGVRSGSSGAIRPPDGRAGGAGARGSADSERPRPGRAAPATRRAAPPAASPPAARRSPSDRRAPAVGGAPSRGVGSRDAGARPSSGRPAVTPPAARRSPSGSSGGTGARARPSAPPSGGSGRARPAAGRGSAPASSPDRRSAPARPGGRPGPGAMR